MPAGKHATDAQLVRLRYVSLRPHRRTRRRRTLSLRTTRLLASYVSRSRVFPSARLPDDYLLEIAPDPAGSRQRSREDRAGFQQLGAGQPPLSSRDSGSTLLPRIC